ncbi:unnamed protein product [Closterium sp. NIES-53]
MYSWPVTSSPSTGAVTSSPALVTRVPFLHKSRIQIPSIPSHRRPRLSVFGPGAAGMGASEARWGDGAQAVRRTAQIVQGGGGEGGKAPNWLGRHRGAQPVNQTGLPEVLEVRQEVWQEAGEERQEEGLRKPLVKHGKQQEVQAEVEAEEEVPRTMVQAARCFVRQPGVLLGIAATLSATCLRAMHPHWGIRDTAGMVMARTFLCLLSPSLPLTLSISLTLSPSTSPPLSSLLHLFPSPFLPFSPSTALPLSRSLPLPLFAPPPPPPPPLVSCFLFHRAHSSG